MTAQDEQEIRKAQAAHQDMLRDRAATLSPYDLELLIGTGHIIRNGRVGGYNVEEPDGRIVTRFSSVQSAWEYVRAMEDRKRFL